MPSTLGAEALIERLVGVSAARVEWASDDTVSRIHVLSDGARPARMLVRDIQSLLEHQCRQSVPVDSINVVELGHRLDESLGRPRLLGFEWGWGHDGVNVSCRLGVGERTVDGDARSQDLSLAAAEAALQAVNTLTGGVLDLRLVDVHNVTTSRGPVFLTLVEMAGGDVFSGSAPKGEREVVEAVIRATLDAVNRQLLRRVQAG
jgi:hypothetical protein